MAKKKVWELAREISVELRDVMSVLPSLGIRKADHLEQLEPEEEVRVRAFFSERTTKNAETTVVARNVVRRRRAASTDSVVADAVPETVPTILPDPPKPEAPPPQVAVVEAEVVPEPAAAPAPEPAPEVAPAEEAASVDAAPAAVEAAPAPVAPSPALAPEVADAKPATVGGRRAPAKPAEAGAKPADERPAESEEERKRRLAKALEEAEAEEQKKKKGPGAKKGRRIVVERKRGGANVRRAVYSDDDDDVAARMPQVEERDSARRSRRQQQRQGSVTPTKAEKRVIRIEESISVADLAHAMAQKATAVVRRLIGMGVMAGVNATLDIETATIIAEEYGFTVERITKAEEKYLIEAIEDAPEDLQPRPPVVTIMGHVDHGKTSLLDVIQKTDLAAQEAGGITQAVGAYRVDVEKGTVIFLDTPGHEAFTAMRARGAMVTDLVILVVAADDGVQPQTIEAINHARAAGVPIVVAVNKIDKENADVERSRRELSDQGLLCEEWGGDVVFVDVSAKQKLNVETLLEMVLLQADLLELRANPDVAASGFVIESRLDKQRGPTCTMLVKRGTLKPGDLVVAGTAMGRVRTMNDEHGKPVGAVRPSFFAEITGLNDVPAAGDRFFVVSGEREAREIVDARAALVRKSQLRERARPTLESLFTGIEAGEVQDLNLIVKADVQGSVEAIRGALDKLPADKVKVAVIHAAVGGITASDVQLASASDAIVIGFNVRADNVATHLASDEGIEIKTYAVIYDLLDDVRAAMEGMLAPRIEQNVIGTVEVRAVFVVPKIGAIAGSYVTSGKVLRNARLRVFRNDIKVYEGKVSSLKRIKDDAREVNAGYECGIGIENFNDVKVGDILEVYEETQVKETL